MVQLMPLSVVSVIGFTFLVLARPVVSEKWPLNGCCFCCTDGRKVTRSNVWIKQLLKYHCIIAGLKLSLLMTAVADVWVG